MVRDSWYAKELYLHCMELLGEIHDSCDMNMVSALINIMVGQSIFMFPPPKSVNLALSYLSIAEATCEALGTTDSEVYL